MEATTAAVEAPTTKSAAMEATTAAHAASVSTAAAAAATSVTTTPTTTTATSECRGWLNQADRCQCQQGYNRFLAAVVAHLRDRRSSLSIKRSLCHHATFVNGLR